MSPYAAHKATGEFYCRVYATIYQLETVCLRYFNVFGPRQDPGSQYAAVIPNFITALNNGDQPTIYGDGEQSRDFTYVENVVTANVAAATAPNVSGEIINVACGQRITVNELARKIGALLNQPVRPSYVAPRPGDVKHSLADITKAQNLLQYTMPVDIDAGLERTVAWFTRS
jgi:UDP-glucose 4-epimerase